MQTISKTTLIPRAAIILLVISTISISTSAQSSRFNIYMDLAHQPKFWNDPADMKGDKQEQRVKYMTDQLLNNASKINAQLSYVKEEINTEQLKDCDLLFIHIPSSQYSPSEVKDITKYLNNGGSMFLVMDVDYWSTLEQTNVNELIAPFGIQYGGDSPDTLSGGYTKASLITKEQLKVTYHGGRIVKGGIPFCFNNQTENYPFGTYLELDSGGKLVVMGDGMVSLYMTSWKDVNDYQCNEFMNDVLTWLLD